MSEGNTPDFQENLPAWRKSRTLVALDKWIGATETGLNLLGAVLIAIIMLFTTYGIVMRYVFNAPFYGKVEITELIMAGAVFFGVAYTQKIGGHVRVSFVIEHFIRGRAHHVVECLTLFLALCGFSIITIATLNSALYDLEYGGVTSCLYLPKWPSKMAVPIGCFFLSLRLLIQFIQHLLQVITGTENRELQ